MEVLALVTGLTYLVLAVTAAVNLRRWHEPVGAFGRLSRGVRLLQIAGLTGSLSAALAASRGQWLLTAAWVCITTLAFGAAHLQRARLHQYVIEAQHWALAEQARLFGQIRSATPGYGYRQPHVDP